EGGLLLTGHVKLCGLPNIYMLVICILLIMTTKTKFSKDDSRLQMLVKRRNLTDGAIKNYNTVFREIYELFGVTPTDIVRIGKREQQPFLDKETGEYDLLELEDRSVTKYQFQYYDYLVDRGLSNRTIRLKLNTYRALLGEYDIEKPKNINIVIQTDRIRDEDIVTWREVESALSFCKGIRDKAIISFFATTGLRSSDVRRLKIEDLIKACDIYFEDGEEKTIDNLLNKNPEDIMPCWEVMPIKTIKNSQLCVTFNTPESSTYLWQYLHERVEFNIRKGRKPLEPNDPLFATSTNNELKSTAIEQLFQRINTQLGGKMDKNGKYRRFRSHSLRKLFTTTCRRNLTQVVVNSDKTSEVDIVSIFTGHVPPNESNSRVYEAIESDSHDSYLRKTYLALSPYLSIKEIEVKDIKTQQYKDLEEQNEALRQQLEAQAVAMQREMDEQKEQYEKKIRHIESVNSALSAQVTGIQNQIDNIANANDLTRIQDYMVNHELVEQYDLASEVINLYKEDVKNDNFEGVTNAYIEELISTAYNRSVAYSKIDNGDKIYNDDLWKSINEQIDNYEQSIMWNIPFNLSSSQKKKISSELSNYAKELWLNKIDNVDEYKVQDIITGIATKNVIKPVSS
ncbi:site-specific integrase, partial [bacterium]|nr:site-specific integrase [bacterium]